MSRVTTVTHMAFVKLDAGILNSTIWVLRPDLEIFITALLMATPVQFEAPTPTIKIRSLDDDEFVIPPGWYGLVEAAGPGLINRAHVELETGLQALERLASPEPESRSQEFDGRRLVRINGGLIVLNFMRYRDKDHTAAERQRRLRLRRKNAIVTGDGNDVTRDITDASRNITQSEYRSQITDNREGVSETESAAREINRIPPELKTPEFEASWRRWMPWWSDTFNYGKPNWGTFDAHLIICLKLGAVAAVSAIDNAISKKLRQPDLPFERKAPAPQKPIPARVNLA